MKTIIMIERVAIVIVTTVILAYLDALYNKIIPNENTSWAVNLASFALIIYIVIGVVKTYSPSPTEVKKEETK